MAAACLLIVAVGVADASILRGKDYPPKEGQNPICLIKTQKACGGGCGAFGSCVGGKCACLGGGTADGQKKAGEGKWGCSDAAGVCRPHWARWLEVEHRMAPVRTPNWYMEMQPKEAGKPTLAQGFPKDDHPTGIWLFLEENNNKSVLIATKQGRYLSDLEFLDLPSAPWNATGYEDPIQRKIESAGQAEWVFQDAENYQSKGAKRIKHLASGRYLCVKNYKQELVNTKLVPSPKGLIPELSSCAAKICEPHSTEFHIWPQNEHLLEGAAI